MSRFALLVHQRFENRIIDVTNINDRILQNDIPISPNHTNTYYQYVCPNSNKIQKEKDDVYDELQTTLDRMPKRDEMILLGDLNAIIGNEILNGIKTGLTKK